jgi:hypothetical protein
MHMVRNTLLILFAVMIDLLQAGISAGLFVVGAFPGTTAGGTIGCVIGAKIADSVGCAVGSAAGGFAGSILNVAAPVTLPFAIGLGFAVNFCIAVTLGTVLVAWLWSLGMYKMGPGIAGFIVELIPGLDNIPGWTAMTIISVMRKTAEEKGLSTPTESAFKTMFTTAGAGAMAAFKINQQTQTVARERGVFSQEQQDARQEEKTQRVSVELKNIDGIRTKNQPYAA